MKLNQLILKKKKFKFKSLLMNTQLKSQVNRLLKSSRRKICQYYPNNLLIKILHLPKGKILLNNLPIIAI